MIRAEDAAPLVQGVGHEQPERARSRILVANAHSRLEGIDARDACWIRSEFVRVLRDVASLDHVGGNTLDLARNPFTFGQRRRIDFLAKVDADDWSCLRLQLSTLDFDADVDARNIGP